MKENIIQKKSYRFAIRIVNLYKYLTSNKKEFVLSKQILRSGTSIGANIEEGIGAQSEKDFLNKFCIAYKEARETNYWLRILRDTSYIGKEEYCSINNDLEEILKIVTSIKKSINKKISN